MNTTHIGKQALHDGGAALFDSPAALATPLRATLIAIGSDGALRVRLRSGRECLCDWLETSGPSTPSLTVGDKLLVMPADSEGPAIVLGRIGRYREPQPAAKLALEATEILTLKCGDSSLEMRADGQVLLRGDDMLLRAKGTQRIRAGTVAIN